MVDPHPLAVGDRLYENVEGHPRRTDSLEFQHAKATLHKILGTQSSNPYGMGPIQAHHGGSIWLFDGHNWRLTLNWAGIEWSSQFCCDPAKVEALRLNAQTITDAFPETLPELARLGYEDTHILSTQVTNADTIGKYVDSIWNSCVPIPEPGHIGTVKAQTPLGAGVHNYPEPMCAIPRIMHDDFVPFVVDPATGTTAIVAPVGKRGSGDGRVQVLYAEPGHPLATQYRQAAVAGQALIAAADSPLARAAFAHQ